MGYNTQFVGSFKLNKALQAEHHEYLQQFNNTRRMKRNARSTAHRKDPVRKAAGLPTGPQGAYFVGGDYCRFGADREKDVVDYNVPPQGQPGLWCDWVPNTEGTEILHSGMEKSYNYVEWIKYLIKHFLGPWGYKLNGEVIWQGEDMMDRGIIIIKNNVVSTRLA
jgi:hypothetical protein